MFVIQDPTDENSTYLLESILKVLRDARSVSGAFAFVSAQGVRLLSQSDEFKSLAKNYPVDLVIGIDGITNEQAITSLSEVAQQYPRLQVRAFLNPLPGTIFHPKFCWTESDDNGHLIVGSGNLTERGLLGQWEAYSSLNLDYDELKSVKATWNAWLVSSKDYLLALDDPKVMERAKLNNNNPLAIEGDWPKLQAPITGDISDSEPATTQLFTSKAKVLIAEVPRSGVRPSQVNFHKNDYYSFFRAEQGRLVVFRQVNEDGTMPDYEQSRPAVVAKSVNFRFELDGMGSRNYPEIGGRPIGIYLRVATRTFFYRILFPATSGYKEVQAILEEHNGKASTKMRTVRMDAEELRTAWPTAPFWKLPTDIIIDTE